MNQKWYKSKIAKAILVVMAHFMIVVMTASFLWIMAYPTLREELFEGKRAGEYSETRSFSEQMLAYSTQAVSGIGAEELFETEGNYNPDKQVDIQAFYETGKIKEDSPGNFSYRLGDLIEWDQENNNENEIEGKIVVCKRPDETFQYYSTSEFFELINSKELQFIASFADADMDEQTLFSEMENGYDVSEKLFRGIQNAEGIVVYSDFWIYDGCYVAEQYKPSGAESVVDIANRYPEWNGKLNDAYDMLQLTIHNIQSQYGAYQKTDIGIEEGNSNFTYIYADIKNQHIYTNKKAYESYGDLDDNIEKLRSHGKYVVISPLLADFKTNMEIDASIWRDQIKYCGVNEDNFLFVAAVDTGYPIRDEFYTENDLYEKYGANAGSIAILSVLSVVLFVVCVLWLIIIAGRSDKDDELHLNWFDRWKTEFAASVVILGWILPTVLMGVLVRSGTAYLIVETSSQFIQTSSYITNSIPYIIGVSAMAAFTCCMFLIGLLSLVRRIKAGTVWKNSILKWLCEFTVMVFHNMSSVWQTIMLFGAFAFVQLLFILSCIQRNYGIMLLFMLWTDIAAFIWLIYRAVGRTKLKKGLAQIAGGEIDYKIPLEEMHGDQKAIARQINSIGDGLDAAVEKSMKSERLKTDLITNVSHDIKTPLTSIINYVELLKQENFENPKIQRYIEVLEQKSQRLKTLTEDVVEASKVSSGNITLEYMTINLAEMIQQSSGEFEEKFKARNLQEVLTLPEEETLIRADGRRTWRIIENIYNNAAKYAMEGTRIYADLVTKKDEVIFSLKNISEQPLNISADELTERFIRGDISRSTEGSGLGLSIAKTLAEMQGGKFELYLDGDLFKATVKFPKLRT